MNRMLLRRRGRDKKKTLENHCSSRRPATNSSACIILLSAIPLQRRADYKKDTLNKKPSIRPRSSLISVSHPKDFLQHFFPILPHTNRSIHYRWGEKSGGGGGGKVRNGVVSSEGEVIYQRNIFHFSSFLEGGRERHQRGSGQSFMRREEALHI